MLEQSQVNKSSKGESSTHKPPFKQGFPKGPEAKGSIQSFKSWIIYTDPFTNGRADNVSADPIAITPCPYKYDDNNSDNDNEDCSMDGKEFEMEDEAETATPYLALFCGVNAENPIEGAHFLDNDDNDNDTLLLLLSLLLLLLQ